MAFPWASLVAVALMVAIPAVAWARKAMMVQALTVTCFFVFILGALTATRLDGTIGGSPLLDDLAFRLEYLEPRAWGHLYTLVTTMFLHADILHVVANMVIFLFMGLGLEERVGRGWFLFLFLVGGLGGTLVHAATNWGDPLDRAVPVVGASGAVFGIIGAYATAYPRDTVVLFAGIILPRVPVFIAAMAYTVLELLAVVAGPFTPVAHYAHLGGVIFGVLGALLMGRGSGVARRRRRREEVSLGALEGLVETEDQRRIYAKLVENRDVPELFAAWFEKFAAATACARCGRRFEARERELRCGCGNRVSVR